MYVAFAFFELGVQHVHEKRGDQYYCRYDLQCYLHDLLLVSADLAITTVHALTDGVKPKMKKPPENFRGLLHVGD